MASAFGPDTWLSRNGSTPQLAIKMRTRLLCYGWRASATALPVVLITVRSPTGSGSAKSDGRLCLDCIFEDSNTVILLGREIRVGKMPYGWDVRPGLVYNFAASEKCRWCVKRLPLCRRAPPPRIKARRVLATWCGSHCFVLTDRLSTFVDIILKKALCQRAIFLMQALARHYGHVQAAVVPRSRVSASSYITLLHVGSSFSFFGSLTVLFSGGAGLRHVCIFQVMRTLEPCSSQIVHPSLHNLG